MELSSEVGWYDCELGIRGGRFLCRGPGAPNPTNRDAPKSHQALRCQNLARRDAPHAEFMIDLSRSNITITTPLHQQWSGYQL